jgi:hypothetical protein
MNFVGFRPFLLCDFSLIPCLYGHFFMVNSFIKSGYSGHRDDKGKSNCNVKFVIFIYMAGKYYYILSTCGHYNNDCYVHCGLSP